jgi:hypothetical protein
MARIAIVALLVLSSLGCSHSAVLTDPPMVTASAAADPQYVRAAVLAAMARRRWVAERDDPGVVLARFVHGNHHVRVWVRYDASNVVIQYADSQNMAFRLRNGVPYIHKAYNKWTTVLSREIYRILACGPRCMPQQAYGPTVVPQPMGQPVAPEPVAPAPAPAPQDPMAPNPIVY